jgi:hypothetical protein
MKKIIFILLLIPALQQAQVGLNITSWDYNTTGTKAQYYSSNGTTVNTLTDSIEIQQVCYNTDTIYVRTNIMGEYIMGPWPGDPFIAAGQNKSYIFPRKPTYPSSTHQTKPTGTLGVLIDGVLAFDDGDGKSYNTSTSTNSNSGSGIWNQIAWIAHASELDAGNCHPDPSKIYHSHANPKKLCDLTTGTAHSPIVGWSFDGWPIYGPFGYTTATDATSAIKRMTSSWALRNITTRTTLYTGTTTSQTGPAVSTTFPLGIYIEDYGYTASSGDLDYYNGRYCVTPEYPSGTYAYFLNTDASGNASYPNMVGPKYYGSVYLKNFGSTSGAASAPKISVSCYTPTSGITVSLSASTSVTCNGASTGAATVSASGGTTYTYSWSPSGGTSASATNLAAGSYTCTVTSGTYTATQTVTISQATAITSSVSSQTNITCNGNTNGAATISASGGTGSYTYSWSPSGGTAVSASSLSASTYTCTIKDANLCSHTQTVTITQPTAISTSVSQTSVTCNGSSTGSATVTASGGTGSLTYSWSPSGGTAATASSLSTATYTCKITDGNSCTKTQTVTIAQPAAITSSVSSQTNVTCNGASTGAAMVTASGGTGSLTYSWSPSGGTAATASSLSAATYTCKITDGNSCTKTQTVTIAQPTSAISSSVAQTSVTCNGSSTGAATVTASGGTGSLTYSWSPSGGTAATASSLSSATYTCKITDGNSCTQTQTVTISQPTAISSSVSSQTNVTCNGASTGAAMVTASGGTGSLTYSWSPSGGTAATASSLSAATYICKVTDGNSCTQTQTVTISQATAISLSTSYTAASCGSNNGSIALTVGGGTGTYTYLWSTTATTQNVSSLNAGTYSVTVTDANSCTATKITTIYNTGGPSLSATSTSVSCNGASTGAIDLTVTGGTPTYTYSWSNGAIVEDISSLAAGTYTIMVTDAGTCVSYSVITVTGASAISPSAVISNVLCNGGSTGSIDLTVSGGTLGYTYLWSNTATSQDISSLTTGNYSVTITDANACNTTYTTTVAEPAVLTATTIATSALCNGGSTGSVSLTVSGGTSSYTYSWSNSATSQNISSLAAGNYSVTITDANACSTTYTTTVTEPTVLTATATATNALCNGGSTGSVNLMVSGGTSSYTYLWSNSATSQNISSLAAGNYSVTITDANTCATTASVTVGEPPVISITNTVTNAVSGNDGAIDITVSGGTAAYTYLWSNSEITEDISGLNAGIYSVVVTDANNCTATATITVTAPTTGISTINNTNKISLYPNPTTGFVNVTSSNTPDKIEVYNIQGQLVYTSSNNVKGFDISEFNEGVYTVFIIFKTNIEIKKLTKAY